VKTKFEKMRANRERVLKVPASFPALPKTPEVPFMEIDGVKYVEAPELSIEDRCRGCNWEFFPCSQIVDKAERAFGTDCTVRDVIYIKAAS
jgi:hypothetical protein